MQCRCCSDTKASNEKKLESHSIVRQSQRVQELEPHNKTSSGVTLLVKPYVIRVIFETYRTEISPRFIAAPVTKREAATPKVQVVNGVRGSSRWTPAFLLHRQCGG